MEKICEIVRDTNFFWPYHRWTFKQFNLSCAANRKIKRERQNQEERVQTVKVSLEQPYKTNNARLVLTTATGAVLGSLSRYVIPAKDEFKNLKTASDSFFSNAATSARGANRSILKYAGVGAVLGAVVHIAKNLLTNNQKKEEPADTFTYSKYGVFADASDYACEIFLYGEDSEA